MNKALYRSIIVAALVAVPYISQADDTANSWETAISALKNTGCEVSTHEVSGVTNVGVSCDRDTIVKEIPALKDAGFLNPDITQTQINTAPNMICSVYVLEAVVAIIHPLYESSQKLNKSHWSVALKLPDDYGNIQDQVMYTFDFNRALDKKINWDNFQTFNLYKVAPNFHLTQFGSSVFDEGN